MENIKKNYKNIIFNMEFIVFSNLVDSYEDKIIEFKQENPDKQIYDTLVLTPTDVFEFIYNSFEGNFPKGDNVYVDEEYINAHFEDFDVIVKALNSTDGKYVRLKPKIIGTLI